MRRIFSAAFSCSRIPRSAVGAGLLLDGEHPDHAALRHVVFETDFVGRQRIQDALRVNTPARLDRDILRAIYFERLTERS
jgi:hypothetical protein